MNPSSSVERLNLPLPLNLKVAHVTKNDGRMRQLNTGLPPIKQSKKTMKDDDNNPVDDKKLE